jgi:plastocyanin
VTRVSPSGRRFGAARGWTALAARLAPAGLALLALTGVASAQSASPAPASMAPASMAPASPAPMAPVIPVTLIDFAIEPAIIEAAGTALAFDVVNEGITPHNLTIRDAAGSILGATSDLRQGDTEQLILSVPAPGTYVTFCSLPGHESLGLVGELVVAVGVAATPAPSLPAGSPAVPASA